ncbi:DUF1129 family protein [Fructobacillus ficulneus]|uniref:Integral membrane protein n=1 Tax=Fructobacillus ficulneus TaxID=157463 RepID=A0A0K8MHH4_9LACO|nr:DUF1129 family protein [Fructobacillus ficulneus]GAO99980.1 integral membrane protein [Fructobacillus ficulneus]
MTQVDHQLSKKNQDFIFRFNKALNENDKLNDEQKAAAIDEVTTKLAAGQKTGQTAAQLYGSPVALVQKYANPTRLAKKFHEYSFGFLATDTALVLIMFLAGFFAITMSIGKSSSESEGIGLTSIILLAFWGGAIYTMAMRRLVPGPANQNGKKQMPTWLMLIIVALLWVCGFTAFIFVPAAVNPILPTFGYVVVFALAWLAYLLNRRHAGLEHGGILAISKLAQQARQDEANNKE